jgi:hypothetical protein
LTYSPTHSFIIDLTDAAVKNLFTDEEIITIEGAGNQDLPIITSEMKAFGDIFKGKVRKSEI